MSILRLLWEVFGPGKPAFGITLMVIFSIIYGIAILIMRSKGKYEYERRASLYHNIACYVGGFGYTFYWMYESVFDPIIKSVFGSR